MGKTNDRRKTFIKKLTSNEMEIMFSNVFPHWELDILVQILHQNEYKFEKTMAAILDIEENGSKVIAKVEEKKSLLPDDFLRVPGWCRKVERSKEESEFKDLLTMENNRSGLMTDGGVKQSVHKKPVILQRFHSSASGDSASSWASRFLKLDITGAENRLRRKESHPMGDLLVKATALFHQDILSSQEFEKLRILLMHDKGVFQEVGPASNEVCDLVNNHLWGIKVLESKGIRPALRSRITKVEIGKSVIPKLESRYAIYHIHVVDIETGTSWSIKRKFNEFCKLYKKVSQLLGKRYSISFPDKRLSSFADSMVQERMQQLQCFLNAISGLTLPAPIPYIQGRVLRALQCFLKVEQYRKEIIAASSQSLPVLYKLKIYVHQLLSCPATPEGSACARFLAKIFHDGMHEGSAQEMSDFINDAQSYVLQNRMEVLAELAKRMNLAFRCTGIQDITPKNVSNLVRMEAEELLYLPLSDMLVPTMAATLVEKSGELSASIAQVRGLPQTSFNIPLSKLSISSWESVIHIFNKIDSADLPMHKLEYLVAAAKQVHFLFSEEQKILSGGTATDKVLSGDDFLPIFIYIVAHSSVENIALSLEIMVQFCDPNVRLGEVGYYLACFEAATSHLLDDTTEEEAD